MPGPPCPSVRVGRQGTDRPRTRVLRATGRATASCDPPGTGLNGSFRVSALIKVTSNETVVRRPERRFLNAAMRHRPRAARMKAAACRRLQRARHLAGQDDFIAAL